MATINQLKVNNMDISDKIVELCSDLTTGDFAGFEDIACAIAEVVLSDGRIAQVQLKIQLEPEEWIQEEPPIETIYLNQ